VSLVPVTMPPEPLASGPPVNVDALPQIVNLILYQGDDFFLDIAITNPDGSEFDLTGWTARAQVRATPTDIMIMATFTASITANVIALHLPNTESINLAPAAVWDCELTSATPEIYTVVAGTVQTTRHVTRVP
jgi:hypothetical protein